MERRHFFAVGLAGVAGAILAGRANAGTDKAAAEGVLEGKLAGGIYYTKEHPGRWAAKAPGHVPVVDAKGAKVTVTTPHEMNGFEHYIVKHTILDADMNVLGETMFDPGKDKAPISSYEIKQYKGIAYAVSMCNKHDCWVTQFTL